MHSFNQSSKFPVSFKESARISEINRGTASPISVVPNQQTIRVHYVNREEDSISHQSSTGHLNRKQEEFIKPTLVSFRQSELLKNEHSGSYESLKITKKGSNLSTPRGINVASQDSYQLSKSTQNLTSFKSTEENPKPVQSLSYRDKNAEQSKPNQQKKLSKFIKRGGDPKFLEKRPTKMQKGLQNKTGFQHFNSFSRYSRVLSSQHFNQTLNKLSPIMSSERKRFGSPRLQFGKSAQLSPRDVPTWLKNSIESVRNCEKPMEPGLNQLWAMYCLADQPDHVKEDSDSDEAEASKTNNPKSIVSNQLSSLVQSRQLMKSPQSHNKNQITENRFEFLGKSSVQKKFSHHQTVPDIERKVKILSHLHCPSFKNESYKGSPKNWVPKRLGSPAFDSRSGNGFTSNSKIRTVNSSKFTPPLHWDNRKTSKSRKVVLPLRKEAQERLSSRQPINSQLAKNGSSPNLSIFYNTKPRKSSLNPEQKSKLDKTSFLNQGQCGLKNKDSLETQFHQKIICNDLRKISIGYSTTSSNQEIIKLVAITSLPTEKNEITVYRNQKQVYFFSILKRLAENVFLVLHLQTSSIFCLKADICSPENFVNCVNEYKSQSYLSHPNLVKLYGGFLLENDQQAQLRKKSISEFSSDFQLHSLSQTENSRKIYLLMEYLENETLKEDTNLFFKCQKGERNENHLTAQQSEANLKRIYSFLDQILPALDLIHSEGIIHRDIKPLNIFKSHNIYKIGDFGSSTFNKSQEHIGTLDYAAPQILSQKSFDKSIDIWSLGCVLYEMCVGVPPFYDACRSTTFQKIIKGQYNAERVHNYKLRDLIDRMIRIKSEERIEVGEIMRHDFMLQTGLGNSIISNVGSKQ